MNPITEKQDRLSQTVAEVLGVTTDVLSEESSPDTISSWDSLGHLNLVIALEEEFGIRLSADNALAMRSVSSIRRILQQSGAEF